MSIISFSQLPEEQIFETYDNLGFRSIVRSLNKFFGNRGDFFAYVYVSREQGDIHDFDWHEVPGVLVSSSQSDDELDKAWNKVYTQMRDQRKPNLRVVA